MAPFVSLMVVLLLAAVSQAVVNFTPDVDRVVVCQGDSLTIVVCVTQGTGILSWVSSRHSDVTFTMSGMVNMPQIRSNTNGGMFIFTLNSFVGMTLNSSVKLEGARLSDNNTVLTCSESSPSTLRTLTLIVEDCSPKAISSSIIVMAIPTSTTQALRSTTPVIMSTLSVSVSTVSTTTQSPTVTQSPEIMEVNVAAAVAIPVVLVLLLLLLLVIGVVVGVLLFLRMKGRNDVSLRGGAENPLTTYQEPQVPQEPPCESNPAYAATAPLEAVNKGNDNGTVDDNEGEKVNVAPQHHDKEDHEEKQVESEEKEAENVLVVMEEIGAQ